MKKNYTLALFFISIVGFSQVTDLVEPKSWNLPISDNNIEVVNLPFNDLAKFIEEDINASLESIAKPYRFGAKLQTNISPNTNGSLFTLDNNDRLWKVGFESLGAKTINFIIKNYRLAQGAELYIYNEDKSMKIGPYTSNENNDINEITTWPIDGDKVYVELYEPKNVIGQSTFTISDLVHGYRSVKNNDLISKALNDSGLCNVDVDCPLGNNFGLQKKSVVMLVSGGNGFCSGTLVNNTSGDKTPYILSANHCFANNSAAPVGATTSSAFRFNWISPVPSCATFSNSVNGTFLQTTNGAIVRASDGESDMILLETTSTNPIPNTWDVVFAGWNRSSTSVPSFTTGIHHPSGDIMKICRDNNPSFRVNTNFNGFLNRVWVIDNNTGGWEQGVTEPGSSGSQLLDDTGLVIGVLSGGSAACIGTNDNGGFDIYGRLDEGWSEVGSFLDPTNTGNITTNHLENILSIDQNQFYTLSIYPNPTDGKIYLKSNLQFDESLSYKLIDIQGREILNGSLNLNSNIENEISLSGVNSGIYLLNLSSKNINQVEKIVIE